MSKKSEKSTKTKKDFSHLISDVDALFKTNDIKKYVDEKLIELENRLNSKLEVKQQQQMEKEEEKKLQLVQQAKQQVEQQAKQQAKQQEKQQAKQRIKKKGEIYSNVTNTLINYIKNYKITMNSPIYIFATLVAGRCTLKINDLLNNQLDQIESELKNKLNFLLQSLNLLKVTTIDLTGTQTKTNPPISIPIQLPKVQLKTKDKPIIINQPINPNVDENVNARKRKIDIDIDNIFNDDKDDIDDVDISAMNKEPKKKMKKEEENGEDEDEDDEKEEEEMDLIENIEKLFDFTSTSSSSLSSSSSSILSFLKEEGSFFILKDCFDEILQDKVDLNLETFENERLNNMRLGLGLGFSMKQSDTEENGEVQFTMAKQNENENGNENEMAFEKNSTFQNLIRNKIDKQIYITYTKALETTYNLLNNQQKNGPEGKKIKDSFTNMIHYLVRQQSLAKEIQKGRRNKMSVGINDIEKNIYSLINETLLFFGETSKMRFNRYDERLLTSTTELFYSAIFASKDLLDDFILRINKNNRKELFPLMTLIENREVNTHFALVVACNIIKSRYLKESETVYKSNGKFDIIQNQLYESLNPFKKIKYINNKIQYI
jgi:hypothetical protein